ncbi:MAG TPA: hypothetical protein VNX18_11160 [Bryobacteraceae bacterium]|nr:hypothetical protein [Bryobacteraceae bacterium]
MPETNGSGESRLDRLERLMDLLITDHLTFTDEHKQLLTAQVILVGNMQEMQAAQKKLQAAQEKLQAAQEKTDEQMKATDERLNVLIQMMDGFIRKQ